MKDIQIAQYLFKIIEKEEHLFSNGMPIEGIIEYDELRIQIQKGLTPPKRLHVILHEIIHGLTDLYNVPFEEDQVDMLAIATTTFIVNNLEFCKELLHDIETNRGTFPIKAETNVSKKKKAPTAKTTSRKKKGFLSTPTKKV